MRCNDLQTKLAVHDVLVPDEARHAETCPECAAFAAFEAGLDGRLAHWRTALETPARRRVVARSPRMAVVGLGLAAALTLGVLALPTRSTATTAKAAYRRMLGQVREVKAVHVVVRWRPGRGNPEDGPLRKVSETWWRPGALREEYAGSAPTLKLGAAGAMTFYRYDPGSGTVRSAIEIADQPDFGTFDLEKFAAQYMDTPTRFDQPRPTTIVATNAGGWSRLVFTLDPATGLPKHADKQFRNGDLAPWRKSGEIDLEFDEAVPEAEFKPEALKP